MPVWLWFCIRARSLWFFTASNPTLTFGGFEGEPKHEMYDQLPKHTYPLTFLITYPTPFPRLKRLMMDELSYPVAVKPDCGRMGLMFRKINSAEELLRYHSGLKADFILQEFVDYPLEVSVFYYRMPGEKKGTITGFIKKEYLSVTGDGISTLGELMQNYPRVRFRLDEMKIKHADNLTKVLPVGETFILCHALNLSRGGKLVSLEHEKDDSLLKVFDELSHYRGHFYFGRYDVKCASIEDLKLGRNFSILEFNGAGAEPHHVYGNGNTLFQALKILVQHWKILLKISQANHKNGIPYWNFTRGLAHLKKARTHFKILRQLDIFTSVEEGGQPDRTDIIKPLDRIKSNLHSSYARPLLNRNANEI
jgi:hypothetical protein